VSLLLLIANVYWQ